MAVHLTTKEINQGSAGFLLRLPFSLNGYADTYFGQTWRVKIVTPDGTIVSRTTGIEFLEDSPFISVPIEDFDLILAGTYYYQVTLTTAGANANSTVETFYIKPSLPEGLPYSIISSAMNYFPIFTSGGALAQSTLRVDGSTNLNYSGGGAVFNGQVTLADEAYSSAWNGKLEAPTKNAIYDLIGAGVFGEANTASNVGTSGVGVFHAKSSVDLQFRKLNSTTNRLGIVLNSNQIDFTINEANLSIASSQVTGDFAQSRITNLVSDLSGKQPLDSDLTAISGLTPTNDDIIQRKVGAWVNRTPIQFKTDLALVKGDVGLGNLDNTSDANKPVSLATQAALDAKAGLSGATFTGTVHVPDDAYAVGWNGNTSVPTKNAIYDKIESILAIGSTITTATQGSVLFAGASGVLAQDNTNFFWDNTQKTLRLAKANTAITSGTVKSHLYIYDDNRTAGGFYRPIDIDVVNAGTDANKHTEAIHIKMAYEGSGASHDLAGMHLDIDGDVAGNTATINGLDVFVKSNGNTTSTVGLYSLVHHTNGTVGEAKSIYAEVHNQDVATAIHLIHAEINGDAGTTVGEAVWLHLTGTPVGHTDSYGIYVDSTVGVGSSDSYFIYSLTTSPSLFSGNVNVPDDAYNATTWNGNLSVPTKNAIRDKIESLSVGVAGSDTQIQFNDGGALAGDSGLTFNKTTDTLSIGGNLLVGISASSYMRVGATFSFNGYSSMGGGVANNMYYDGSNWRYITNNYGILYWGGGSGEFGFYTAASGTAGNVAALNPRATISNQGGFYLGSSYVDVGTGNMVASGKLATGIGATAPTLAQLQVQATTEQVRVNYDTSNYYKVTVGSTGTVTYDAVGSGAKFVFSDAVEVPDDAYDATTWNGNVGVPTKNAIRDKIESLSAGVSDGDKGDITVSSSGATWTIDNGVVSLAKMADVATSTVFYRKTGSTGPPEVQTLATLKTDLGLTGTNSGDQTITLTGAVTGSGTGSFSTSIASDAVTTAKILDANVTYAKIQNVAGDRLLGRVSSSGVVQEITLGTNLSFSGTTLNATGGATVGNAVSGGTNNTVLYKDGSGNLGSNANLGWNGSVLAVTGNVTVTDDDYDTGWNTSIQVPTKNAIYDRWQVLHNYVLLEDYGNDLQAAITAIGTSVDTELRVSNTVNISSADVTVPANIYLSFNGKGIFNISSGRVLTIHSMVNPGDRKLYTGLGTLIVTRQKEINVIWWTGKSPTSGSSQYIDITQAMWTGMMNSGYGGLIVRFTEGRWRTSATLELKKLGGAISEGVTLKGVGSYPDPSTKIETDGTYYGTVIQLTANNDSLIEVPSGYRSFAMEDITLYIADSVTGSTCLDLAGDNIYDTRISRCGFYGGDYGIRAKNTSSHANLIINLDVRACEFNNQYTAGFLSETSNSGYTFIGCAFTPRVASNGTVLNNYAVWLNYAGAVKLTSCTFNGFNINERTRKAYITSINTSTGLVTAPNHEVPYTPTKKAEPVVIRNNQVETNTVVGTIGASGAGNVRIVITAAEMTGVTGGSTTRTIDFAVANNDTATQVATKARTALNADIYITQFFEVGGSGAIITLLAKGGDGITLNDATMNFSIDNLTSSGLTASPTSTTTAATTANLPVGYTDKQVLYFYPEDANTGYLYLHPSHVALGTGYRIIYSGGAGSNNVLRTGLPVETGVGYLGYGHRSVPHSAIRVDNTLYNLSVDNCQDEGFQWSLYVGQTYETKPIEITNSTMQSGLWLGSQCDLVMSANIMPNRAIRDDRSSSVVHVVSRGDFVLYGLMDMGRTQYATYSLGNFTGTSVIAVEESKLMGNVYRRNGLTTLGETFLGLQSTPVHDFCRPGDYNETALLVRMGTKDVFNSVGNSQYYYDFSRLNSATIGSNFKVGYLEIKGNDGNQIYNGLFANGHLAWYGKEVNEKVTNLVSVSGSQNLDCSLGSRFYVEPNGDITLNFTNTVAGQRVTIVVYGSGTSRTVIWGSSSFAHGSKRFRTGGVAGYWTCEFISVGSTTMLQLTDLVFNPSGGAYTSPQKEDVWRPISTTSNTFGVGQKIIATSASQESWALPANTDVTTGDIIAIKATTAAGWRITQASGQQIVLEAGTSDGVNRTTSGTSGYLESADTYSGVELVYIGSGVWSPTPGGVYGAINLN